MYSKLSLPTILVMATISGVGMRYLYQSEKETVYEYLRHEVMEEKADIADWEKLQRKLDSEKTKRGKALGEKH